MNLLNSTLPRIARQLNYSRSFPTVTTSRVDIPCIPYEAFDNTGYRLWPWSLLRLFESARVYTFFPNYSQNGPNRSTLDMHVLLQDHYMFQIATGVIIKPDLNNEDTSKFPIHINSSLTHIGKSSKTLTYELRNSVSNKLYATLYVKDILIATKTRKQVKHPDWWLEKFSGLILNVQERSAVFENHIPTTETFSTTVKVTDSDTAYNHTNWISYVRFCYDSLYQHIDANSYKHLSRDDLSAGIESINMSYKSESSYGDELQIVSWEKESLSPKTVRFYIMKGENVCFQSDISFFKQNYKPKAVLRNNATLY